MEIAADVALLGVHVIARWTLNQESPPLGAGVVNIRRSQHGISGKKDKDI
jgi:hypothetical protein